jgi:D-proline reductase (dithiol) PrdB
VTTAAPYDPDKGDQGPRSAYNAAAKFYRVYSEATEGEPDVRVSHVGIDRKHTSQEDMNAWFPLAQMKRLAAAGRIGAVAPRFHGVPTNRSQRTTLEQDCPDLLGAVREDAADVAVLAAN